MRYQNELLETKNECKNKDADIRKLEKVSLREECMFNHNHAQQSILNSTHLLLLAIGIVNEYLSSLMKCLHPIGECMFNHYHA